MMGVTSARACLFSRRFPAADDGSCPALRNEVGHARIGLVSLRRYLDLVDTTHSLGRHVGLVALLSERLEVDRSLPKAPGILPLPSRARPQQERQRNRRASSPSPAAPVQIASAYGRHPRFLRPGSLTAQRPSAGAFNQHLRGQMSCRRTWFARPQHPRRWVVKDLPHFRLHILLCLTRHIGQRPSCCEADLLLRNSARCISLSADLDSHAQAPTALGCQRPSAFPPASCCA